MNRSTVYLLETIIGYRPIRSQSLPKIDLKKVWLEPATRTTVNIKSGMKIILRTIRRKKSYLTVFV